MTTTLFVPLKASYWSFAADMFAQVLDRPNNICFSPFSISMCFALIAEAADGATKKQLFDTFQFPDNYLAQLAADVQLIDQSEATIKIANSFWLNNKYKLNQSFMKSILDHFHEAEGTECDFSDESACSKRLLKINSWVKQKTAGHIPKIIQYIDAKTILLLINAVYFDGIWQDSFKSDNTRQSSFHLLDNLGVISVATMSLEKNFEVIERESFKALSLPYDGKDVLMYIILPAENTKQALDQICQKQFLTEFLTTHKDAMEMQKVQIKLPKFKFNNYYELVPILQAMGLTDIFDILKADLSKMTTDGSPYVSEAIHKTFVEVDEDGTRAAAATVVLTKSRKRKAQKIKVIEFNVDRPFVFMVYHKDAEQILFLGKVLDPNHKGDNDKKRNAKHVSDETVALDNTSANTNNRNKKQK